MKYPSNNMKVWVVMARIEEIHGQRVDKVFDSKGKTHKYIIEQDSLALLELTTL
jgi:hypothetical protein